MLVLKQVIFDTWGRGTLKIINTYKEALLPEPEIIERDGGVQVTIFKIGGQDGGQDSNLTIRQKVVLEYIMKDPKISRSQLAEKLGINESAVQKHLDALKKKGVIKRDGETTGYWNILIET